MHNDIITETRVTFSIFLLKMLLSYPQFINMYWQGQCDEDKTPAEQIQLLQLAYDCNTQASDADRHDLYVALWLCRIRQNMAKQVGTFKCRVNCCVNEAFIDCNTVCFLNNLQIFIVTKCSDGSKLWVWVQLI